MNSKFSPLMTQGPRRSLGHGVGLRPPHYPYVLENKPDIAWFEVISENFMGLGEQEGGRPISVLEKVRENYPIVLHGVSLSIGSVDPLDQVYLTKLKALVERIQPSLVSDHLCWTGVNGENLHDLLPLPYNEEAITHVSSRIAQLQDFLGRQMLFENVSSYMSFESSEMTEWEFVAEVAKRSGCGVLLDVNNIYVSATNHGFDPVAFLDGIPVEAVGQFHLAGHSEHVSQTGFLVDTHDHPVSQPVWTLYERAVRRFGKVPTLIEWDDKIPSFPELLAESRRARVIEERILAERQSKNIEATSASDACRATTLASMDHHRA